MRLPDNDFKTFSKAFTNFEKTSSNYYNTSSAKEDGSAQSRKSENRERNK